MAFSHSIKKTTSTMLFPFMFCLLGVVLVACGNTSTASGNAQTTATATCTATPNPNATRVPRGNASGTIQSVQNGSFVVTTTKNGNVNVSITSTTRISQVQTVALSALKEGASATFQVKQDSAGNYTATVIMVTNLTGQNGQQRGNGNFGGGQGRRGCGTGRFGQGQFGQGANGQQGQNGSNANTRFVFGTIGQINGQKVTVTDAQGNDYTVTVDSSTRITQTATAAASDLKAGLTVAVTGTPISNGSMTAQNITISQPGTFQSTGTPTGTNS